MESRGHEKLYVPQVSVLDGVFLLIVPAVVSDNGGLCVEVLNKRHVAIVAKVGVQGVRVHKLHHERVSSGLVGAGTHLESDRTN